MAQIIEDYVSFETAKLLKEKGFDEDIDLWYDENGDTFFKFHYAIGRDWRVRQNQQVYLCPTLQMAMKWLREVYNIACQICPSIENGFHTNKWHSYIHKLSDNFPKDPLWFVATTDSYEEACEAAIQYCLKNLI